jgi:hypothetical protein
MSRIRRIDTPTPRRAREVQAVQVEQPVLVHTDEGQRLAGRGEWLVTDSDGTVRVLSNDVFRFEALHQQLLQLVVRSPWGHGKRR